LLIEHFKQEDKMFHDQLSPKESADWRTTLNGKKLRTNDICQKTKGPLPEPFAYPDKSGLSTSTEFKNKS